MVAEKIRSGGSVMLGNVLIFGDSYSTYEGYIPEGYDIYYYKDCRENGEVKSVNETWWHRVITEMGGNLVRCDSWSGSAICYTGYWGADRSETSSFVGRFQRLKKEGFFEKNRIDTVFIFGGTNDTGNDSPLGTSMYEGHSREDLYCVLPAISYLMSELKKTLPDACICFIVNDEYLKPEIRDEFFRCAKYYGRDAVMPEGVDKKGGHPSTLGMEQIAKQVVDYLKNKQ